MTPHAPNLHLFQSGAMARLWPLLGASAQGLYLDGCLGIAKGVAYSGLLAFFPALTTVAAVLVQAQAESVSRTIARLLYDVVPQGTEDVVRNLFVVHGQRPLWLLVTAIVFAAWAASGAMMSMIEGFRAVYRIADGRGFVRDRLIAIMLVFTSALPVLGASSLIVVGKRAESDVLRWIGVIGKSSDLKGWVLLVGQASRFAVAFAAIVLASALLYYLGPNRRQRFRQVIPGAIIATVLWLLATLGFSWYVNHVARYNVLYIGVGGVLALLVWIYLLGVILLFGCEFNWVREKGTQ
jgi:membrane protein